MAVVTCCSNQRNSKTALIKRRGFCGGQRSAMFCPQSLWTVPSHASPWFVLIPQVSSHQQSKVNLIHTNFNLYETIQSINTQQQRHIIHDSYINSIKMFLHKVFTWLEKLYRTRKTAAQLQAVVWSIFLLQQTMNFIIKNLHRESGTFHIPELFQLWKSFLRAKAARTFF